MLLFSPLFKKGDFVIVPEIPNNLFRVEIIETKWYFFHSYFVSEVSLENFDCSGCSYEPLKEFKQGWIQKAHDWDVIILLGKMISQHFGNNRRGKPWTHIEHNILKEIFPWLKYNSQPEDFETDTEAIFNRSFSSIKYQFNKVTKLP